MNPLAQRSLLMHLHIRKWAGEVSDKEALNIVAKSTQADTNQDKYTKSLFVTNALAAVDRAAGRIRTHFYYNTMAWSDGGGRLIPSLRFRDFALRHKELVMDFEREVENFLERYPDHKEEAQEKKGDLYHEHEYPHILTLREKFAIELITLPFPNTSDFRVEAPEEVIAELKEEMKESIGIIKHKVDVEVLEKLKARLEAMLEALSDGRKFRQPHFSELQHITEFATSLGAVLPDSTVQLVVDINTHILPVTADQVRSSETLQRSLIKNIKEALKHV